MTDRKSEAQRRKKATPRENFHTMKIFYDTGEVAEMLDIPASTVRYWAEKFKLRGLHKTTSGRRKFGVADVERMKEIYHLVREKGLTIEAAKARLRGGGGEQVSHDQELMARLLGVRALLEEIRQELPLDGVAAERGVWSAECGGSDAEDRVNGGISGAEDERIDEKLPPEPSLNPAIVEQTLF
jgi:DNA-binding transcriptional MerR regulator